MTCHIALIFNPLLVLTQATKKTEMFFKCTLILSTLSIFSLSFWWGLEKECHSHHCWSLLINNIIILLHIAIQSSPNNQWSNTNQSVMILLYPPYVASYPFVSQGKRICWPIIIYGAWNYEHNCCNSCNWLFYLVCSFIFILF